MTVKRAIGQAFGAAARYDDEAHVQRKVAGRLARHIATLPLPPDPRILEIGCGTGFLTSAVRKAGPGGRWTVTDLSAQMVRRCRDALGEDAGERHFLAMDGERPCFAEGAGFDLICSSLAFQWFEDLETAIARLMALLAPGGHLAFTTMAGDSFAEWRAAHGARGLKAAVPDYPSLSGLAAMAPAGVVAQVNEFRLTARFESAHDFLRHLRGIGAHVPRTGRRPLAAGAMRGAMRAFEQGGAAATYHIACCTFTKAA